MSNLTPAEREAMEAAWEKRGVPPDIPDSPWRVGAALHDEFEQGWLAAREYYWPDDVKPTTIINDESHALAAAKKAAE